MTYIPRDISRVFRESLASLPVVVLTGLRQTGKSTFLANDPSLKEYEFESLDDLASLDAARDDPTGFVAGRNRLVIDEAQRCPELMIAIKAEVDRDRRPGRFVLSGSARFALMSGISESLAGRAIYLTMPPMTRREIRRKGTAQEESFLSQLLAGFPLSEKRPKSGKPLTWEEIRTGGFPPVVIDSPENPQLWFKGYEQTYIERDIRRFSDITNLSSFRKLLQMCALRTAQVLNRSEIARDAGLKVSTASRYISILETSFMTSTLPPYLTNRTSRLIKSPKVFLTDSGFACYLAGLTGDPHTIPAPLRGALLETYVFQNLTGILESIRPGFPIHFWNVQGRHEVDFVIENRNEVIAIEVKFGARWKDADLSGLRAFMAREPRCQRAILAYNGPPARPVLIEEGILAVPVVTLLS